MKKRKTFAILLDDLELLESRFDTQFDLSDALKDYFEESFNKNNFEVIYKIPRSVYEKARTQKNVFLEQSVLDKYNGYIVNRFGIKKRKEMDNYLSRVFTSLSHEYANKMRK